MLYRLFFVINALILTTEICSQHIFFPGNKLLDSTNAEISVSFLAQNLLMNQEIKDVKTNYNIIWKLKFASGDYEKANEALDSFIVKRNLDYEVGKVINFHYRVYCLAMMKIKNNAGTEFEKTYEKTFIDAYSNLSEKNRTWVDFYFKPESSLEFNNKFHTAINLQRLAQTDSISFSDAIELIGKFCEWKVYENTLKLGKAQLVQYEINTFIREDSIFLKLPTGASVTLTVMRKRALSEPMPVILQYSIYAKPNPVSLREEAVHDYVSVLVNTRGKYLSNDSLNPFESEASDAYYIIDWISRQSWCNGKVGMYGGSYDGFTQWSAAKRLHPALKTIVPQVSVGAGIDFPLQNGIFMSYMLAWIHYVSNNKYTDGHEFNDNEKWNNVYKEWFTKGKSFQSLDTLEGRPNSIFQEWLKHSSYDKYWKKMTPQKEEFIKISIPVLTISGYYDDDQLGAMYYFKQHNKWNKNANHYLLIGPYDHFGAQGIPAIQYRNYTIDSVARISITDLVFEWFDFILKGAAKPKILMDKINYQVMGANQWRHAKSMSELNNDTLTFFMDNTLKGEEYMLVTKKTAKEEYIKQEIDFADRKLSQNVIYPGEYFEYNIIDSVLYKKENSLVFASNPLKSPFLLNGSFISRICVEINKKDVDLYFDLYEQMLDGKYFLISHNIQRASYSLDKQKRQLLIPGRKNNIIIDNTFFTSRQISAGSRLFVIVGVMKDMFWQVNYGTGKNVSKETISDAKEPLLLKWFNSSYIKIPIYK